MHRANPRPTASLLPCVFKVFALFDKQLAQKVSEKYVLRSYSIRNYSQRKDGGFNIVVGEFLAVVGRLF
jgi:hypothetical protein